MLALRVLAEPTDVTERRAVASGFCTLDVCWQSIGLCAFDVNRTRCAALYMSLYVQSEVAL